MNSSATRQLKCACSNCPEQYCVTRLACFRYLDEKSCQQFGNYCNGCIDDYFEILKFNISSNRIQFECCNQRNFCNADSDFTNIDHHNNFDPVGTLVLIVLISLTILSIFLIARKVYQRSLIEKKGILAGFETEPQNEVFDNQSIEIEVLSETSSGYGQCELIQRTIARDIHVDYNSMLGKGRYGTVWLGRWNGDLVAVKTFLSLHEASWQRETDIYQTCLFRHDNLLGHIASDIMTSQNGSINMLLITEYHPYGSLFDYLTHNTIDTDTMLKFTYSIVNGLNHLHQEIFSTRYKPSIAHRDLKTKNILVKSSLECCICDFGLAVRYNSQTSEMEDWSEASGKPMHAREGSVRYMAPECLENTVDLSSIDSLKKCDVYSYALVMWEILSRVRLDDGNESIQPHQPPYSEYVIGDPSVDAMKDIVCNRSIRPMTSLDRKTLNKDINVLTEIMKECWSANPNERPSCLNIKKKMQLSFR